MYSSYGIGIGIICKNMVLIYAYDDMKVITIYVLYVCNIYTYTISFKFSLE